MSLREYGPSATSDFTLTHMMLFILWLYWWLLLVIVLPLAWLA
jgi:hypothetical protein